jgi:hypothetical protein
MPYRGVAVDLFQDFAVILETANGTLRTYSPEVFREAAHCPSTLLLSTCVERYNARMAREGINESARLKLRTSPGRRR